jgi:hypothetical protein
MVSHQGLVHVVFKHLYCFHQFFLTWGLHRIFIYYLNIPYNSGYLLLTFVKMYWNKELLKIFCVSRFNTLSPRRIQSIYLQRFVWALNNSLIVLMSLYVWVSWLKFLTNSNYHLCHMIPLLSPVSAVYMFIQSVQFLFLASCRTG